jgi:hypothetical protein
MVNSYLSMRYLLDLSKFTNLEYLYHKWSRICSTCRKNFPVLSSFMTYHRIRVITKLPKTEQSSTGKGKTHMSTNRQIQSTTGKLGKPQCLVQTFPKKWWVESDFTAPNLPLPLRLKGSGCHYNSILNNTETIRYNSSQRSTPRTSWKSIFYCRLCRTV